MKKQIIIRVQVFKLLELQLSSEKGVRSFLSHFFLTLKQNIMRSRKGQRGFIITFEMELQCWEDHCAIIQWNTVSLQSLNYKSTMDYKKQISDTLARVLWSCLTSCRLHKHGETTEKYPSEDRKQKQTKQQACKSQWRSSSLFLINPSFFKTFFWS